MTVLGIDGDEVGALRRRVRVMHALAHARARWWQAILTCGRRGTAYSRHGTEFRHAIGMFGGAQFARSRGEGLEGEAEEVEEGAAELIGVALERLGGRLARGVERELARLLRRLVDALRRGATAPVRQRRHR